MNFDRFDSSRSDFTQLAKFLMLGNGSIVDAAGEARERSSERVARILNATAADLSSPTWAGSLADYRVAVAGFVEGLRQVSVFDRLLADGARRVEVGSRAIAASAVVTGSVVGPGEVKQIGEMSLDGADLEPRKAVGIVVVAEEVLRSPLAEQFLARELKNTAAAATDAEFLSDIVAALTVTGTSSFTADISSALAQMNLGAGSRVYVIVEAAMAAKLALKTETGGALLYPDMGPQGGTIAGIAVLASDQLDSPSAGSALVVDASGLVLADQTIVLTAGRHASLAMEGGSTANFNMWQRNCVALRAERYFAFAKVRDDAAVEIVGPSW